MEKWSHTERYRGYEIGVWRVAGDVYKSMFHSVDARGKRGRIRGSGSTGGFGPLGKQAALLAAKAKIDRIEAHANPLSNRALVVGGVALAAVVGGVVYIATRPASTTPPPTPPSNVLNQPATQLTPGHIYRFSSIAPPGSTTNDIAAAIGEIGFANARVWTFGDTTAPADYNWPPETRSNLGVLIEGKWTGPAANVPKGIFGLIDYAPS